MKVWSLPITASRSRFFKDRALPFEHYQSFKPSVAPILTTLFIKVEI
jgi:hypothetical protein